MHKEIIAKKVTMNCHCSMELMLFLRGVQSLVVLSIVYIVFNRTPGRIHNLLALFCVFNDNVSSGLSPKYLSVILLNVNLLIICSNTFGDLT